MEKYHNYFQDSNDMLAIGLNQKGDIQRIYFPSRDFFEFVEHFKICVQIDNSKIIYLGDDINNIYETTYIEDTNIAKIRITNTYFNIEFEQDIYVHPKENLVCIDFKIFNHSNEKRHLNMFIDAKLNTDKNNIIGTKIYKKAIEFFNHEYQFCVLSKEDVSSHLLNDVENNIYDCNIKDKDIVGMGNEAVIKYDLGVIDNYKEFEFRIFLTKKQLQKQLEKKLEEILKLDFKKQKEEKEKEDKKYLGKNKLNKEYLEKYKEKFSNEWTKENSWKLEYVEKIQKILQRSSFCLKNLQGKQTGAIVAALEVDEKRQKSGMYNFVWPRDSIFMMDALERLGRGKEVEKFYLKFIPKAQNEDGSFEQRYYCDGTLAPSWGYQIDETASVVFGIYKHFEKTQNLAFLEKMQVVVVNAIKYLIKYVEDTKNYLEKNTKMVLSYDLWEMHEGISLYSICSIIGALNSFEKIQKSLKQKEDKKVKETKRYLKSLISKFVSKENTYKRNLEDENSDISILGLVYPFNVIDGKDEILKNTLNKIDEKLKTYTNGYLRFENDSYINNPWPIANIWYSLYEIEQENIEKAKMLLDFVIYSASPLGYLGEQVDNSKMQPSWVTGLGWSHAMFIIVLDEMVKKDFLKII